MDDKMLIFGGSGSPRLTKRIGDALGTTPGRSQVLRFSDGNLFVRVQENVRGRNVYIVQSTAYPANDNFMELLFWIDALKRASAASVTAVVPYFSYAKGDKKDEPRVSIRARVCADAIEAAGVDRLVTMDLHAAQIQGFFKVPVDDLYALPVFAGAIRAMAIDDLVVVSPDIGFAKRARSYAKALQAPLAIADKERAGHDETVFIRSIIGEVTGRRALIVDDFTISADTLAKVARKLLECGAVEVLAAVTHAAFSEGSQRRVDESPLRALLVTDTIETQPEALSSKVQVVSVASLFAEAIRRIHKCESISVLFPS